jgi:hypothetical protein
MGYNISSDVRKPYTAPVGVEGREMGGMMTDVRSQGAGANGNGEHQQRHAISFENNGQPRGCHAPQPNFCSVSGNTKMRIGANTRTQPRPTEASARLMTFARTPDDETGAPTADFTVASVAEAVEPKLNIPSPA